MILDIVKYGDERLRVKSVPVSEVDEDLRVLAKDMMQTMYARNGAGLAAQQVGRSEAVCIVDVAYGRNAETPPWTAEPEVVMPIVLVNPEIVSCEGREVGQEGCLSFPEVYVNLPCAAEVTVEYTGLDNERRSLRAGGLLARAIQHELDHLNGVLLVDRMSHVQKVAVSGKLRRLRREGSRQAVAMAAS